MPDLHPVANPHLTQAEPPSQAGAFTLGNARLVLSDGIVPGSLQVAGGRIASVDQGLGLPTGALDCDGDLLAPGLIELHTDNLERHLEPRPGVAWPKAAAIVAHDAELAGLGITTVFDALRIGSLEAGAGNGAMKRYARPIATEIRRLQRAGMLRIDHGLHLRAEICSETLTEELAEFEPDDGIGIVSLMDHTPGQRQFRDINQLKRYWKGKRGIDEEGFADHVAMLNGLRKRFGEAHERAAVTEARRLGAVIASHDDTTEGHVAVSARHGARLAEFPTTREAAASCRDRGIPVMMGGPNLLRGGSHSGNVAAAELADAGLLDILSSDYAPASLLMAATVLGARLGDVAHGLAAVTCAPARAAGLTDRGSLAPGLRADLVRIRMVEDLPLVRGVWSKGRRVA